MREIKNIIKMILPLFMINLLRDALITTEKIIDKWVSRKQFQKHEIALRIIQKKILKREKIKVAFFALSSSTWKCEDIYKLLDKDERFEPIVVVCPVINYGKENMIHELNKTYKFFEFNKYKVIKSYNMKTNKYLDIKKEIAPDIIFYLNPYRGLIDDRYYITNFEDCLTCYIRYFFPSVNVDQGGRDFIFYNRIWKFFCETEYHKNILIDRYPSTTNKYVYTGYPGIEGLNYINKKSFKEKNSLLKKIIWAPHHTIDSKQYSYDLSNFLNYHQLMINLSAKYLDRIIFIFKPHPLLKVKLYNNTEWGKEKTDEYYNLWESLPNTMFQDDGYKELFNDSDAMIFDCNSFVIEYIYTGKPALFTYNNSKVVELFNDFGQEALKNHYHAYSERDIIDFIEKVVLDEFDEKKDTRDRFYYENLIPPNNKYPSQNIVDEICNQIFSY